MTDLKEKSSMLPDQPGVYIMKDKYDEIIYVGKGKSLRKRVRQYFQSTKNKHPKVVAMVRQIDDFEYIIVDNEVEALILEANLIKKHRPKYNILLKDDKQYPYIKVTLNEKYPRVIKTRRVLKDGARYFGPYPNVYAVNDTIDVIREVYQLRVCNRNLEKSGKKERPCLNFYIGKCLGPCQGNVDEDKYMDMVNEVIMFLSGRKEELISLIETKMNQASANLDFEEAARYRDKLTSLNALQEKQTITTANDIDQDVIGLARGIEEACIQIFFIRNGKIMGREHFILEDAFEEDRREIISSFLKQFYIGASYIPKEIIIEEDIEDQDIISTWLSEKKNAKVNIHVPQRGDKKRLVEMVKKNAVDMLDKHGDKFIKKSRENQKALDELKDAMNLSGELNRIEAYDISNISGVESVGSMVVFEKGEKKSSDYRRFKIRSRNTPDDYGSMEEILKRRFKRGLEERKMLDENKIEVKGFSSFPDLIMMDGGKGQVNVALRVLYDLDIDIPVCGLVKDEFHKTRGIIYKNREIKLDESSLGFKLIYRIQEEAHRFAISYHRSLRSKKMFKSELDDIKGIGEKRKIALLKHFGSIEKIKKATVDELRDVKGMNILASEELYNHFRSEGKS